MSKPYMSPLSYFVVTVMIHNLAHRPAEYIHRQSTATGPWRIFDLWPELLLILLGLVVMAAAYKMLYRLKSLGRWIILIAIASGVACSFVLETRGDPYPGWAIAAYFLPQLLLLFARKQPGGPGAGDEK
jgi:hypothetical protein